ncbi:ectoine hydroxylase-related dioxygenase (phytanoyl-CoA dioxygenase family) [Paenibacillus taihuensis]|uniref:Ectoine hydroxylase-related dioxygenase (Phytanoyl-CoA dioxygenase family) n=2 Tax=Paenibacillus taihuensis TaxID=1156355 RepID=A0A3D9RIQ2_9BACL|nr:ectoine hydroxylase-related dioxygenase (phytanoyl-CoA dioxygenase family) [Paenibacillus taihuensis]
MSMSSNSSSIKEQFEQDGYYIMRQLYSEDEIEAFKNACIAIVKEHDPGRSGVLVGMTLRSPLFKQATVKPSLVEALREIIGEHIVFLSDKVVLKNAGTDFGSPWHQDHPYWDGSHKFSVWIALDDAMPSNGCLRLVPGSHQQGTVSHDGEVVDDLGFINRIDMTQIADSDVLDFEARRGDAVIFHDLLFHASYPNVSGKERWALITTYKDGTQEDPDYEWAGAAFAVSSPR